MLRFFCRNFSASKSLLSTSKISNQRCPLHCPNCTCSAQRCNGLCSRCEHIHSLGFFDLFRVPNKFSVDLVQLRRAYYDLQRRHHPDSGNAAAEMISCYINRAFETLKDPFLRACYLTSIEIEGNEVGRFVDEAFLGEILELREAALESGEKTAVAGDCKQRIEHLQIEFQAAYTSGDGDLCEKKLVRWKFLRSLLKDLENQAT